MPGTQHARKQNALFDKKYSADALKLRGEERRTYEKNPHLRQAWVWNETLVRHAKPLQESARELAHGTAPLEEYKSTRNRLKSVEHIGQRKLLLSEIEFFTRHLDSATLAKRPVIIYAGAAPGCHTMLLARMFPGLEFELWDPVKCVKTLLENPDIFHVHQAFFTDAVAEQLREMYQGRPILFLCDIRSGIEEKDVAADMAVQARWVEILRPRASLLKFRLPWTAGKTKYLKGRIVLQVWAPQTTTETRLEVVPSRNGRFAKAVYDNRRYESEMYWMRVRGRTQWWPWPEAVQRMPYIREPTEKNRNSSHIFMYDHCYDCVSELYILHEYIQKVGTYHKWTLPKLVYSINKLLRRGLFLELRLVSGPGPGPVPGPAKKNIATQRLSPPGCKCALNMKNTPKLCRMVCK